MDGKVTSTAIYTFLPAYWIVVQVSNNSRPCKSWPEDLCCCQRYILASQASSDIEIVNGLWKGLGYYSRAARLLSGAKKVVDEFNGRMPDNAKDMEAKIPGIGRYSAGAICSIAYNQCVPVVSGIFAEVNLLNSCWRRWTSFLAWREC